MVKLDQDSSGPDLPQAVKLSNGSCSTESSQAVLKINESAQHPLKVSATNGNCAEKSTVRENPWKSVNGSCINKLPVNGVSTRNGNCNNKQLVKETPTVNGYSKKVTAKDTPTVNGCSKNLTEKDITIVNGYSKKVRANDAPTVNKNSGKKELVNDIPTVNGDSCKKASVNAPSVNGNCSDGSPTEVPVINGTSGESSPIEVPKMNENNINKPVENCSNGSITPPETLSCSKVQVSDSLCNEENCDENELGFIEVVSKKKRNQNRQKNHRKKHSYNLPPGMNAESIRCDKGNDKKLGEKTSSPTHLSQKPPTRNFAAVRSSGKSYSSALLNGQTGNTQMKNGVSNNSTDTQKVIKCTKSNKPSNNCDLPGTIKPVAPLPTNTTESAASNDKLAGKCKLSNSSSKVEMTDVSAQTDDCLQNETPLSQKECLSSEEACLGSEESCHGSDEACHGSEKNSSLSDYVEDTDFVGETDDSSNAAYSESVVSNDSGRGDSEVIYDEQMPYCCEFPKEKVKNLIGKHGSYKFEVERQTGVRFWVPKNVFVDENTTIIAFMGTGAQIEKAKELIKKRFRQVTLKEWPGMQGEQWLNNPVPLSERFAATLPLGTGFMGVVSCIFTPHYFWLQQWGHPVIHPLEDLERRMSIHFNTVVDAPGVVNPMIGNVVVVPVYVEGEDVKWVRGEIVNINPENATVIARYLDHGGESEVPASEIRPMRHEFLSIPFFAAKCCLFGILPEGGVWSEDACAEFKRLCSSSLHPPIFKVIFKVDEGYFVNILGYDDERNSRVDVADALIKKGFAMFDCNVYQPPEPTNDIVQ